MAFAKKKTIFWSFAVIAGLAWLATLLPNLGLLKDNAMEKDKAIELARHIISGMKIPPDAPVEIESVGNNYVITFKTVLPPGTLGPDYHAKVTIDRFTGEKKQIMVGS